FRFLPIAWNEAAGDRSRPVLTAYRIFRRDGPDGLKKLRLFGAHRVCIEASGRLHCYHGKELEKMVWHHIPQRPSSLVKAAALLNADGLCNGDLDVLDVIAPPERF